MNKILFIFLLILFPFSLLSQENDTVFILFDNRYDEMEKSDFTAGVQAGSPDEKLKKSIAYLIRQMEKDTYGDTRFRFTHSNHSKKTYRIFGGEPPVILKEHKSFLKDKRVLDIKFFRTTPYIKVAKTFEEEDSWEEDVMIFIVDVDEMKNDSITMRQVYFTRPVKE